ncbi:MAG: 2-oxoacid:acceptor oxidoreductase family protein [Candidatus Hydrogenedentes bacterium]|nr:2-oxoacid:acceptor oxidoreductase family protein [Candidatus Hydrogenedentota bacterium]
MQEEVVASNEVTEIRISGYGGQGVVLAGQLLGKAASLYDNKSAVFTQSYGPEARGGASCADVVVSSTPVDYPLVSHPDVLVTLFQEAYMKYRPMMKPGGILILEPDLVQVKKDEVPHHRVPATKIAEGLGRKIVANVVALGYLVGITNVVGREAVEECIRATVKKQTIDLNLRAFDAGYSLAAKERVAS